jgi:hypothetical protein
MTSALTQQQIATFRQVFDALFDFLRWTYGFLLSGPDRAALQARILTGWGHPDGSVPELLAYLGGLHTTVFGDPPGRRDRYRPQVRQILAGLFTAPDPTERGQVLAVLHGILEHAAPGCTGVVAPPRQTVPPLPPTPPTPAAYARPSAHGQPPAGPLSFPGAAPWPGPAASAGAHVPGAAGATGAPGAYAAGAYLPGAAGPQGPGTSDPDLIDLMRTRDETARIQALMMDQNIWKMRSDLASKVIDSMSR